MMPGLAAYVDGIGLLGPGLPDWTAGEAVLAGNAHYVAAARAQLPARRRCRRPSAAAPARGQARAGRRLEAAAAAGQDPARPCDGVHVVRRGRRHLPRDLPDARHQRPPDFADPLPQLGAQRSRRLLEHRHRCDGAVHVAVRVRRQLRRGPARGPLPGCRGARAGAADRLRHRVPGAAPRVRPIADAFGIALAAGARARRRSRSVASTWSSRRDAADRHGRSSARIAAHGLSCRARAAAADGARPRASRIGTCSTISITAASP